MENSVSTIFVIDISENKLRKYEENLRLIDFLTFRNTFFFVVDSCNIEDFGLAMLMGHVISLILWMSLIGQKASREPPSMRRGFFRWLG